MSAPPTRILAAVLSGIVFVGCMGEAPASPTASAPTNAPPAVTPPSSPTAAPRPTPTLMPTPAPSVRVVYAIPSDRLENATYEAAIRDAVLDVQGYYAGQLDGRTFTLIGELPQVCSLPYPASRYEGLDAWGNVLDDLQSCVPISHHSETHTWIVYVDTTAACRGSDETLGQGGDGVTIIGGWDLRGLTSEAPYRECDYWEPRPQNGWIGGLAHELGLAFGLDHPACVETDDCPRDAWTVMDFGFFWDYPDVPLAPEEGMATARASPFLRGLKGATPLPTKTPRPTATPTPEPSVRAVYAIPNDRLRDATYEAAIRDAVLDVQGYYAGQLDGRTFTLTGELPQVCSLPHPASHYEGLAAWENVLEDLQPCVPISHHSETYTWIVYVDTTAACRGSDEVLGRGADGVTIIGGWDLRGLTSEAPYRECDYWEPRPQNGWIGGLAHELGLAFGLDHPACVETDDCPRDAWTVMDFGYFWNYPDVPLAPEEGMAAARASPFLDAALEVMAAQELVPTAPATSMPTPTATPTPS